MRVLIAEVTPELSDWIQVALESFGDMEIDQADGLHALERLRRKDFHCVFVEVGKLGDGGQSLLNRIGQERQDMTVVVLAPEAVIADLKKERARQSVSAFLKTPPVPIDLYRTIARVRQRHEVSRRA